MRCHASSNFSVYAKSYLTQTATSAATAAWTKFLPMRAIAWPANSMLRYELTQRADAALIEIYERSVDLFGVYQAEAYQSGLKHTFELLANFPNIGRFAEELRPGFRRATNGIIFSTP